MILLAQCRLLQPSEERRHFRLREGGLWRATPLRVRGQTRHWTHWFTVLQMRSHLPVWDFSSFTSLNKKLRFLAFSPGEFELLISSFGWKNAGSCQTPQIFQTAKSDSASKQNHFSQTWLVFTKMFYGKHFVRSIEWLLDIPLPIIDRKCLISMTPYFQRMLYYPRTLCKRRKESARAVTLVIHKLHKHPQYYHQYVHNTDTSPSILYYLNICWMKN